MGQEAVLPEDRRRRILEHIQSNRCAKSEDLARELGVSLATVRRDLDTLVARGLISRTHGGAVPPIASTAFERRYSEKQRLCREEKRRIGAAAAALVGDGETLILDSGSTTLEVARNLTKHRNLTIITYDLLIATELEFDPSTTLIVAGGLRRAGFCVCVGALTENFLREVRVNKSFLSADAVDLEHGITNATFAELGVKQLIIKAASEVILVADHTKFGNVALARVGGVEQAHQVITDSGVDAEVVRAFASRGIPLKLA
ncbi:MAG: DeoR/GlpR family DNA-binding transcription regulator [Chitinophagales bacterium]